MWFFKTENGTFCIRYLREGYGLFIGQEYLSWHKDAESAAKQVRDQRTGYLPWDSLGTVDLPEDISNWQTPEDFQTADHIKPTHDPVVVPVTCRCGHQISESIGRIRTIGKFPCPVCKQEIMLEADRVREIYETARRQYPNGYIKGISPR